MVGDQKDKQESPSLAERLKPLRRIAGNIKRWLRDRGLALQKAFLRALALPATIFPGGPGEAIAFLNQRFEFNTERAVLGYHAGMYPMGNRRGKIVWDDPPQRAIMKMEDFHIPRRVRGYVNKEWFDITFDKDFRGVITACAGREVTWITPDIIEVFVELHQLGLAHSVEAWQDGKLVGGAYGTSIGSLFGVESMFFRVDQASKVAFVHLAQRLQAGGYTHVDCQSLSKLWYRFGARNIPREQFKQALGRCIVTPATFDPPQDSQEDGGQ
jgi:leucyl/phenylalanyl-tRNA--protein transferase